MIPLNVLREGEGPIVVLSHALGCNLHMWDGVAALLARAHTVIRYDHRDHGGLRRRARRRSASRTLADDAAALIEREAGRRAGALRRPLDGRHDGAGAGGAPPRAAQDRGHRQLERPLPRQQRHGRPASRPVQAHGVAAIADGAVERWITPGWRATPEGAAAAAALRDMLVKTDAAGYVESCKAVAAHRLSREQHAHRGAHARHRRHAGPGHAACDVASRWWRRFPASKLATIDAAHLSAVEKPDEFVALLIDFWRSL